MKMIICYGSRKYLRTCSTQETEMRNLNKNQSQNLTERSHLGKAVGS
jgi:hypothetical protein